MKTVGNSEYSEENEIGRGAFGTVYKGLQTVRNNEQLAKVELVAIKKVDVESYIVKRSPNAIIRETAILNTLSSGSAIHKNIVTLLHCEKQTRYVYFVMEFCNGGNLKEYLHSRRKLDEHTVRIFLRQITAGLKAAHDSHIIHRDLKPENILLCFSGPKYPSPDNIVLKIADFGIGRFLSDDEMAKTNCGSMQYMAPEIFHGRPYHYKVDLWCVGVIAYECVVGPLPENSRIGLHGAEIPPNTCISADFANILKGLLETDENKRTNMKQVFSHPFLGVPISVYVDASGTQKTIHVRDNQSVDHLMDIVCANYNTNSQAAYLIHEDGRPLERGSGNSLREAGIVHNNRLTLVLRLNGGCHYDGKTVSLLDDTSSVSHKNCTIHCQDHRVHLRSFTRI